MARNVWVKLAGVSLAGILVLTLVLWGVGSFNRYNAYNNMYRNGMYMNTGMGNMYNGMNMNAGMNMNSGMNMQGGMGMMDMGMMKGMDMMNMQGGGMGMMKGMDMMNMQQGGGMGMMGMQ